MLVMEEKQNFFLWCNYVKYSFNSSWYNAVSELVPIIFTSTAVSLTCSVAALLCSLLSSLFSVFLKGRTGSLEYFSHKYQIQPVLLNTIWTYL